MAESADIFHGARSQIAIPVRLLIKRSAVSFSLQRQTGLPEGAGEDVQTGRGGGVDARGGGGPAAPAAGRVGAAVDPAGEAPEEAASLLAAAGAARDSSEGSLEVGVVGVVAGHNSDIAEAKQWQVRND